MNALELADYMENTERWNVSGVQMQSCAEMLRRQHEAIKQLREALSATSVALRIGHNTLVALDQADQALKDTEEYK